MWFLSWGPAGDLKLSTCALHIVFFVPLSCPHLPPSLAPTGPAVVTGPALSPFGFHPFVPVQFHPWPCPVHNHHRSCPASHLCCSGPAWLCFHRSSCPVVPLAALHLHWLDAAMTLISAANTNASNYAVSQEALDDTWRRTELLSLMLSLHSTNSPSNSVELVDYRWLTFERNISPRSQKHTLRNMRSLTHRHAHTHFKTTLSRLWFRVWWCYAAVNCFAHLCSVIELVLL